MKKTQLVNANCSKVFKPLVASSLAFALSASVAMANPTYQAGLEGSESSTLEDGTTTIESKLSGLTWNNSLELLQSNPSNITFNFTNTDQFDVPTSNNPADTFVVNLGTKKYPSFIFTSTEGLQMGTGTEANGVTTYGTFLVDMGVHNVGDASPSRSRTFTLDLSQATGVALRGDLRVNLGKSNAPSEPKSVFIGKFGGDVEGNIFLLRKNAAATAETYLTFDNGASVKGNIEVWDGITNITFNAKRNNDGKILKDNEITGMLRVDYNSKTTVTHNGDTLKIGLIRIPGSNSSLTLVGNKIDINGNIEGNSNNAAIGKVMIESGDVTLGGHLLHAGNDGSLMLQNSSTLTLKKATYNSVDSKGNPVNRKINGLSLNNFAIFNLSKEQAVWSEKMFINGNNTIDLRNPEQDKYNLLEIGNSNRNPNLGLVDGLNASTNIIFNVGNEGNLGGEYGVKQKYGYAASDRIVIHNAGGGNKAKVKGTYSLIIDDKSNSSHTYQGSGTGTETKGNIAIASVAKLVDANPQGNTQQEKVKSLGLVSFDGAYALNGNFEVMTYNLTAAETDGKGNGAGKGYITYFLDGKTNDGLYGGLKTSLSSVVFANTDLFLANLNSLNKRMGELRNNAHSQGAWGRIFTGRMSDSVGLGNQTTFLSLQAGYDYAFGFEGANNFLGLALSYSNGHSNGGHYSDKLGSLSLDSINSHLIEFGIYNSYVADSGWYNDSIAKFGFGMNDAKLKVNVGSQTDIDTTLDSFTFALSNEVGYRAKFGNEQEFFIDPQVEIGMGLVSGTDLLVNGSKGQSLNATSENLFIVRSRIGASFGYDFKKFTKDNGINANLYVGGFVEDDHFLGGGYSYADGKKVDNTIDSDTRFVVNVGTNVAVKEATRIYVDFEKSFGGKITTDYKFNAGVRYSFGENAKYKSVQEDNQAPVKLKEDNK